MVNERVTVSRCNEREMAIVGGAHEGRPRQDGDVSGEDLAASTWGSPLARAFFLSLVQYCPQGMQQSGRTMGLLGSAGPHCLNRQHV